MRHITEEGLQLIKRFESFSATLYLCPAGYRTIGYGHVVKPRDNFPEALTEEEGLNLLAKDIVVAERAVLRLINVSLTDDEFDALVSFTFNEGGGALQRSALRQKVNRGDNAGVPAEFIKWVWGGGRKLKGLIRRRRAEALLYQS